MTTSNYQLVVIGAGPAGMAAAQTAARHGVQVAVIDEQDQPGGQIYRRVDASPLPNPGLLGQDYLYGRQLVRSFRQASLDYLSNSSAWYLDASGEVGLVENGRHRRLVVEKVVIACGAQERPMPFPGWDKPGVMTAGAGQILMKSAAMVPAEAPVLVGSGPLLLLLAWQYLQAGVTIRAIVDTTPKSARWSALRYLPGALSAGDYLVKGLKLVAAIRQARIPWFRACSELCAEGEARVSALRFRSKGQSQRIETGLMLIHQGVIPAFQMADAAGCSLDWDPRQQCWQARVDDWGESDRTGIFVAGDAAGIGGARAAALGGQLAGLQIASQLGNLDSAERDRLALPVRRARSRHLAIRPFLDTYYRVPDAMMRPVDDTLACRCEEVSVGELRQLVAMGCPGPNQAKAFSRCGMGPCQGRFCGATVEQIFYEETGRERSQIGRYHLRPPLKPITLGQLAKSEETT